MLGSPGRVGEDALAGYDRSSRMDPAEESGSSRGTLNIAHADTSRHLHHKVQVCPVLQLTATDY